ncbi:DUF2934 domain-containing protein [Singulisphaera sp. Ch08]|uniref:DUF2934 domain-containing protein n=1 Tax=Singulisphaera sp. Ch08 TaxID=3120278 RepID=A0AAU7CCY4_9BACT
MSGTFLGADRYENPDAPDSLTASAGEPSPQFADSELRDAPFIAEVASRAYGIWLGRGRPEGTDREDWFEAERQLWKERGGMPVPTYDVAAEQAREANERLQAQGAGPSNRDRMVAIGRGNQQAGRQGS